MPIRTFSIAAIAFLSTIITVAASASPNYDETEPLKTVINPPHLMDTLAYGFSQAAIVSPNAKIVYISGQIGISQDGPNDFETQVDRSFDNLTAIIKAAGGRIEDVVKITLLIKNHDDKKLQYLVKKRRAVFGDNAPASTLIPVPTLALDSLDFEIDAIVVMPK